MVDVVTFVQILLVATNVNVPAMDIKLVLMAKHVKVIIVSI